MSKYDHAEAFCLMTYQNWNGTIVHQIWNSRDGVTPFAIFPNDVECHHIDMRNDKCVPWHIPEVGDWVFVSYTEKSMREVIAQRVSRYWESVYRKMFVSERAAADSLFNNEWYEGSPRLVRVTEELLAEFMQRALEKD